MRAGRTLVTPNVSQVPDLSARERAAYAAANVQAYVMVPLILNGQLRTILSVHQQDPRDWTADEVALI